MKSKLVKTMLFAFLTVGLAVSCAPKSNPSGGGGSGGEGGGGSGGEGGGGEGGEGRITTFPVAEVKAFYAEYDIDVGNLPLYSIASEDAYFETDDEFPGYFDVYVNGSSHTEMVAYKDALLGAGWEVIGESGGDYRLNFTTTDACVDLIDFEEYIDVSFFVQSDEETYYADLVAADFNDNLKEEGYSFSAKWQAAQELFYLGVTMGSSSDQSEANLARAANILSSYLPDYMVKLTEVYGDPESEGFVDMTGTGSAYYAQAFVTPDMGVTATVIAFISSGTLSAAIMISGPLSKEPEAPGNVKDAIEAFAEHRGIEGFVAPDFSELDSVLSSVEEEEANEEHYANLGVIYSGNVVDTVLGILEEDGWDVPSTQTSWGYECISANKELEADVKYYSSESLTTIYFYSYEDLYGGGGEELESVNDIVNDLLTANEVDTSFPDFSDYDSELDDVSLYTSTVYFYFEDDIADELCALFTSPAWTESVDSFGDPLFTRADGCVKVNIYYSSYSGRTVMNVSVVEPPKPADWGDFESLTGLIEAFLEAREVEGHTVPDLSEYEASINEFYYDFEWDEDTAPYVSLWINGNVVSDVLDAFTALGYTVPEKPASSGYYQFTSPDDILAIRTAYNSTYSQTVVVIQINADVYVPPFVPGEAGYLADAIEAFAEHRGIEGFEAPDFTSLEANVIALEESEPSGYYYASLYVEFDGNHTEEVLAIFDDAGWDVPATAGDYGYECISEGLELEADVMTNSASGNTTIRFYSYADLYSVEPLDDLLAEFFEAVGSEVEFPSFAAFEEYEEFGSYPEYNFAMFYIFGDVVDELNDMFTEAEWTHSLDDYGDDLYTSPDGTVSVSFYYLSSYDETGVSINVSEPVIPLNDQIADFEESMGITTEIPDLSDYDEYFDYSQHSEEARIYRIILLDDFDEALATTFAGWEHSLDDEGDDLYTSPDGLVTANVYVVYGETVIDFKFAEANPGEESDWPANEIADYMEEYGFDSEVPEFVFEGGYASVEVSPYVDSISICIELNSEEDMDAAAEAYIGILEDAGFEEVDEYTYSNGVIEIEIYGFYGYFFIDVYAASAE